MEKDGFRVDFPRISTSEIDIMERRNWRFVNSINPKLYRKVTTNSLYMKNKEKRKEEGEHKQEPEE